MSTQELKALDLSEEDAFAFFDASGVNLTCELCGKSEWAVVPGFEVSGVKAIAAVCVNCGNMRFHAHAIIRAKRDRDAPGGQ